MRSDWVRLGLVVLLCSDPASAQSHRTQNAATAIATVATGDPNTPADAAAVNAQKKKAAKRPIAESPSNTNCAAPVVRTTVRGIDADGHPYVETVDADGTRRHRTRTGVTITSPNGRQSRLSFANAPPPTAPILPETPESGRTWFDQHNKALLALISQTVNGDATALNSFSAREMQATGGDILKQIYFRTDALQFLAGAP
jgi:hypothetical protein